ncbi:class I adenylate-forming enzyme family protein [Streptomyces sp. MUM 16J]|uniref:class I adenylate-forming enzyme family protein n=1 Tax=Streptomyces sp. MUM 16J TaxID=2791988 RepID=UPI001F03631E|nr:long-chain fatty acid--CoA ligase [Streptomyces sp. MUM 16J]MCH0559361.1 AMP-binding protein [Streptomyces sp. MUM 16J]
MSVGPPVRIPLSWARHEHYAFRLLHTWTEHPDAPAVYWSGHCLTARESLSSVLDTAAALRDSGITPGDTVALLTAANHPTALFARYSAHLLGAAVVSVRAANPRSDAEMLPPEVQAEVLRDTGSRLLVADETTAVRAAALVSPALRGLVLPAPGSTAPQADSALAKVAEDAGFGPDEMAPYDPEARARVTFTSGTTGLPKGIVQSYRTWNATVGIYPAAPGPGGPGRILAVTPVSHTVGSMVDAVLAAGGCAVLHEHFDADEVLDAFGRLDVTDTYLAVPHLYRLAERLSVGGRLDLSALRRVVYSGTPAAPHRIAEALRWFEGPLSQLYGSSEAGGICGLDRLDHQETELLGSVGRPFPWVGLRLRDPETGRDVPRGASGEVCVRSATVMDGYLGLDPAEGSTPDGWLRTGDLGHLDVYGRLRLTGRLGQVIKSGGQKVHPVAVERVLTEYPAVRQAVVFGVRDHNRVERVHAAVSLYPGSEGDDARLRAHVGARLDSAHVPVHISRWPELPLNDSGKPDVRYLRGLAQAADSEVGVRESIEERGAV